MPKAHSKTLWKDCCSKGITTAMNTEMEVAKFNIGQLEKKIASEREKAAVFIRNIEENLEPQLATAKVRIIFFNFAKVA